MLLNIRRAVTTTKLRGMAPALVILLLLFCSSSGASAPAGENGCQGAEPSARICAPSGVADPIPVAVQRIIFAQVDRDAATPLPGFPVTPSAPQFRSDPSAPRAPPLSLV